MKLLDRLVVGSFFKLFVLGVLATPPLFILGEFTEDLDRYVDLNLTMADVAHGFLYRVPEYVVWSFPIAGLIAAIFTVYGMTQHREIVAAKAGGVSFHRLVAPILVMALLITGAALWLTELAPHTNRTAGQILRNENIRREWRSDFVYQSEHGLTLAARRLTMDDRRLSSVLILRKGGEDLPTVHVESGAGVWSEEEGWIFEHGRVRYIYPDGGEDAYQFGKLHITALTERPEDLLDEPREDEEMTYEELGRAADIIERSGGNSNELRVRREQRLAIPAATLVIILFGMPLATSSKRGGTAFGIGIALGTTIFYILLLRITGALGSSGTLTPVMAAWLPNMVFLALGLVFMSRVRT